MRAAPQWRFQPAEMVENISGVGLIEMQQSCKVHISPVGV